MLKTIRVSAMLLALVGSAYAGEILTPPAPELPKTSTVQVSPATDEDTAETMAAIMQNVLAVLVNLLP
jgi:hypothetical protein